MKKALLLKPMLLLFALIVGSSSVWADKSTLTFTAACGGSGTAYLDDSNPNSGTVTWSVTSDGTESSFDNTKGIHYGTSSAQVTYIKLTTSDITGTISSIKVNASTASGVTATVGVTVGGSAFGGDPQSLTSSAADYTFTDSKSGEIIVTVTKPSKAAKALYVKSIEVTYTPSSGSGPSIVADDVELEYNATTGSIDYTIDNSVSEATISAITTANWISGFSYATAGKVNFTTTVNNTGAKREAEVTLNYSNGNEVLASKVVKITQKKQIVTYTYTLANAVVPGRHYIVVGKNGENYKALGSQGSNNRAATAIEVTENDQIYQTTINSEMDIHELLLELDSETGYFTLLDESEDEDNGGYLYAASSSKNYLRTQVNNNANGKWTILIDNSGVATVKAQGENTNNLMRYNSSSNLFSCYGSGQNDIYLFERDGDTGTQDFTASINAACTDGTKYYGTFSAPFAFTVPFDVTVSEIALDNNKLKLSDYDNGAVIPANTGVMISSSTAGDKTFTSAKGGTSKMGSNNRLRPTYWGINKTEMGEADPGCKYYRLTMHNGTDIGFWWGAASGAAFDYETGYRSYLAVPTGSGAPEMGFGFDDATTNIQNIERTINDNQYYTLDGRRVAEPTKGLYILNGKKVVIK